VVAARPELPAAAEELAREVTLFGTHAETGAAIADWFDAGADAVQLVLPFDRPEAELEAIVDAAARAPRRSAGR
jgi:alkanesulfonate monooxygenase SsuD/methylene tetrahydromethanopterin reductase-like flavin-dependent oxidoreductase (luciferase family)